jgi:hypothetical protein
MVLTTKHRSCPGPRCVEKIVDDYLCTTDAAERGLAAFILETHHELLYMGGVAFDVAGRDIVASLVP